LEASKSLEENPMDVYEAITIRKSIRSYRADPIPHDILQRILEAGRMAPSAANRMPWKFIVITEPQKRQSLADLCTYGRFLAESPVVIVGCGDRKSSPKWYVVDTTIALENMVLAATGEGIGTCWIGSFPEEKVRDLLKIPEDFTVIALLAVGYPKDGMDPLRLASRLLRPTKALKDIACLNEFTSPWS
jgi:nitroreductase